LFFAITTVQVTGLELGSGGAICPPGAMGSKAIRLSIRAAGRAYP